MGTLGTLIATRNLFVNSDDPAIGECRDVTYNLPQNTIECRENQHMRLTLNAFSMRNSWYRVNKYNNTFFLLVKYSSASTYHSVRCTYTGSAAGASGALGWPAVAPASVVGVGAVEKWLPDSEGSSTGNLVFTKSAGVAPAAGLVITAASGGTYTVNANNAASNVAGFRISIPPANYTSFEALCNAIETQLQEIPTAALGGTEFPYQSVTWDSETNLIQIVAKPGTVGVDLKFVCYTINPYVANDQSLVTELVRDNTDAVFQNSYELVGGCFQKTMTTGTFEAQFDATRSLFAINGNVHKSSYNATLQTEENIYLRTNLTSSSFQTSGFDTGSSRFPAVVPSRILAKIPLNNPQFAVQKSRDYPIPVKLSVFAGYYGNGAKVEQKDSEGETATSGNDVSFDQTFTLPASGTFTAGDFVRQLSGSAGRAAYGTVKTTVTGLAVVVTCVQGMFAQGTAVSMKAEQTLTVDSGTYTAAGTSPRTPPGRFVLTNSAGNEIATGQVKTTVTSSTSVDVQVLTGAFVVATGNVLKYTDPLGSESTVGFTVASAAPTDVTPTLITAVADTDAQITVQVFCGEFKTTEAGGELTIGGVEAYCFAVDQKTNEYTMYTYERPYELIQYADNGNNMYSLMLQAKKVGQIQLTVTDSFGRLWPEISAAQIECNAMPFTASLRIDVFQE